MQYNFWNITIFMANTFLWSKYFWRKNYKKTQNEDHVVHLHYKTGYQMKENFNTLSFDTKMIKMIEYCNLSKYGVKKKSLTSDVMTHHYCSAT